MGEAENTLPPSKKRAAGRELSRDNPGLDDEEESSEQETGTFKKASDEVLANRRIVKVRRHQTSSTPSAPSSNPFAAIRLVPSIDSSSTAPEATKVENEKTSSEDVDGKNNVKEETDETKDDNDKPIENKADEAGAESGVGERKPDTEDDNDEPIENKADEAGAESGVGERKPDTVDEGGGKTGLADDKATEEDKVDDENNKDTEGTTAQNKDEKENDNETIEKGAEAASLSSFQQLSSTQNAFTGLTGTGFSSSTFSFGSIPKDGSPLGSGSGSLFGLKNDLTSYPSFGFGLPTNGNSSSFGTAGVSVGTKSEGTGFPPMQVVPVETGEENENAVFTADSVLFEFIEGGWKERGKGELKVNVSTTGLGKARLVMRARGNYRLILNASLYPDMKLTNMEKRGITFACMNSTGEGKGDLSTFALKFKDGSIVEEFRVAVEEHKGKSAPVLKTPENSP